jgi:hypothetical protein
MTGQKDRYSTTEKLWNLDDKQLTTPKHDELVLMLLNKEYCFRKFDVLKEIPPGRNINIYSEVPITHPRQPNFIIGYWDVVISLEYSGEVCFIECKPSIDSFGATLRQLNTYREYLYPPSLKACMYLFTPDVRFKDAFESQGIKVISP